MEWAFAVNAGGLVCRVCFNMGGAFRTIRLYGYPAVLGYGKGTAYGPSICLAVFRGVPWGVPLAPVLSILRPFNPISTICGSISTAAY